MPDRLETEIKLPLEDAVAVREALIQAGAISQGRYDELNIRFDDARRTLTRQGMILRLRRTEGGGDLFYTLTVKTRPEDADSAILSRREIELTIADAEAMSAILEVLGYRPYWRYEKRREVFTWRRAEAVLDEMPYGWFLEIEGGEDDIRDLIAAVGLSLEDGLPYSYAEIFENIRRNLNLDAMDLTFEAFQGIEVTFEAYLPPNA